MRRRLRAAGIQVVGRLYLVTARIEPVAAAIAGGVDMVQLRDKEADDAAFLQKARALASLCREHGIPFLVNDRAHLVTDARADGVHLGGRDLRPEEARRLLGEGAIIGLSTHDRAELAAAAACGADYAGLGPVFPTATKDLTRTPGGPALMQQAAGATLPVFAIGGIHERNLASLVAAGARRIAVSSAICEAEDPRAAAEALRKLLLLP